MTVNRPNFLPTSDTLNGMVDYELNYCVVHANNGFVATDFHPVLAIELLRRYGRFFGSKRRQPIVRKGTNNEHQ